MKALELANWAELQCDPGQQAAAELRRLAEVNAELLGALETIYDRHNAETMARARAAIAKAKEQQ